jgi:flagellar hook-associated protein 1 FlgK
VENSAINLKVEERLQENATLISLGNTERTLQPADPDADPLYTYERRASSNDTVQKLAGLTDEIVSFDAAGGLASSEQALPGYLGDILASYAAQSAASESEARDNQLLLDGLNQRIDSFQGVNIDEELANTVIFQNSYNASARVISIVGEMFDALFSAVN